MMKSTGDRRYTNPVRVEGNTRAHRHSGGRALARYGLDLGAGDWERVVAMIDSGHRDVVELSVQSDGTRRIVAVRWRSVWLPLVYDPVNRCIVTALPAESLGPHAPALKRWEARRR